MRVYVGSENVYVADRMPPTASRAFGGFTMLIIQSRARLWKKILHIYSYTYLYNGDDVWCPIFYFVLLLSTTIKKKLFMQWNILPTHSCAFHNIHLHLLASIFIYRWGCIIHSACALLPSCYSKTIPNRIVWTGDPAHEIYTKCSEVFGSIRRWFILYMHTQCSWTVRF